MCDNYITSLIRFIFFFKQKTAYEMRISDWSSDVCSSDLGDADEASAFLKFIDRSCAGIAHCRLDPAHQLMDHILGRALERHLPLDAFGHQLQLVVDVLLDRKSTRLNPVTNAHLVCRLLLDKKKTYPTHRSTDLKSIH